MTDHATLNEQCARLLGYTAREVVRAPGLLSWQLTNPRGTMEWYVSANTEAEALAGLPFTTDWSYTRLLLEEARRNSRYMCEITIYPGDEGLTVAFMVECETYGKSDHPDMLVAICRAWLELKGAV